MKKSKSLIFFGTETFSLNAFKTLVENKFNVVAVVTKPDSKRGRSGALKPSAVKKYSLEIGLPIIQHTSMKDVEKDLEKYDAFAAILSSFGRIIPTPILDLFEGGIINIHPSLLPKYRGASPVEQTILNGDKETGVSLIKLVEKMDAGPIYAQSIVALSGTETSPQLYETLASAGSKLLVANLPEILDNKLESEAQDESKATFAPMITKQEGLVDWNLPGTAIVRQIRAYLDWPKSHTEISGKEVIITKAYFIPSRPQNTSPGEIEAQLFSDAGIDSIVIYCKDGAIHIQQLTPAGKREMTAKEFLAGNRF